MKQEHYDVILEDVDEGIRPRMMNVPKGKRSQGGGWQHAALAGQIGFDVAVPMVVGLVAGTKLDALWGTHPKATLLLFFGGLFLGCASLIRIVRESMSTR